MGLGIPSAPMRRAPAAPPGSGGPLGAPTNPGGPAPSQPSQGTWGDTPTYQRNPYAGMDPLTASLRAQLDLQGQGFQAANNQLRYDLQYANKGYRMDQDQLNADHRFGMGLLNQSAYRDVGLGSERNVNAYNIARDRYSDAMQTATGQFNIRNDELFRALGIADDRYGLAGTRRDLTYQDLGNDLKFTGKAVQTVHDYLKDQYGLADERLAHDLAGSQLGFDQDTRGARSTATAAGGMLSAGFRDTNEELARQLQLERTGADISYRDSLSGLDRARADNTDRMGRAQADYDVGIGRADATFTEAGISHRDAKNQYDIGTDRAQLSYDDTARTAGTTLKDNRLAFENQQKMLTSLGATYGLKGQEMNDTLKRGAERLGLDYANLVGKLTTAMNDNDRAKQAAANSLLQQLMTASANSGAAPTATQGPLPRPAQVSDYTQPAGPSGPTATTPYSYYKPYGNNNVTQF